jgi:ribosomal protein S18 acetylase RimI-like enzyme
VGSLHACLRFLDEVDLRAADRVEELPWGRAVLNLRLPSVHELNLLIAGQVPAEVGAPQVAAEAGRVQGRAGLRFRHLAVRDPEAAARLAPGLQAAGWTARGELVMTLERRPGRRPESGVVEVEAEVLADARRAAIRTRPWGRGGDEALVEALLEARRVVAAAVPTRHFAALVDGRVAAWCELRRLDGRAQVEDVFTLPAFRSRGLAGDVVTAACRAAGADPVFLVAWADDWPQHLYRRLGFEPAGLVQRFLQEPAG